MKKSNLKKLNIAGTIPLPEPNASDWISQMLLNTYIANPISTSIFTTKISEDIIEVVNPSQEPDNIKELYRLINESKEISGIVDEEIKQEPITEGRGLRDQIRSSKYRNYSSLSYSMLENFLKDLEAQKPSNTIYVSKEDGKTVIRDDTGNELKMKKRL